MTNGRQPLHRTPRGSARGGVPDDELRVAWARWLGILRARGWDPSPVLRPGAAASALALAEQALGHALPEPVRALYALTDGQASPAGSGGPVLFPAREFCSLDRAVVARSGGVRDGAWPLAESVDGIRGLLVVDCRAGPDGTVGRVVAVDADGHERVLADGIVDYLGLLSVADLGDPTSESDGAVFWDVPALR